MDAIIKIGTLCYPGKPFDSSERLFVHQFGDGFLIHADFGEPDASRPVSIAIALMRHMLIKGFATKAAISSGEMSDITGCYPSSLNLKDSSSMRLGAGILTIIPAIGSALTKAHKLSSSHRGAVLIIDKHMMLPEISGGFTYTDHEDYCCIDWITSQTDLTNWVSSTSGLIKDSESVLRDRLKRYITQKPTPSAKWIKSTIMTIGEID